MTFFPNLNICLTLKNVTTEIYNFPINKIVAINGKTSFQHSTNITGNLMLELPGKLALEKTDIPL